jgi:hypothetical protein
MRIAPGLLVSVLATTFAWCQTPQEPVQAISRLFDRYPIVMLGELHGSIQEHDLLEKLVTSREFANRANDVVIEACNSRYQDVLDRYIEGRDVPIKEVRKAWENTVGAPGGSPTPPYHGVLALIRENNQKLPQSRRLRVLCGDPPIDWDRVQSREDIAPFLSFRDEHYASVVRYEVLAKRRKALLIMGSGHFQRREGKPGLIEQQIRGSFATAYVIIPGSNVVGTYDDLDAQFETAPAPWLMEMKDTWLAAIPRRADTPVPGYPALGRDPKPVDTWGQTGDAYLYLGPRDRLTQGGEKFDLEGTPYGAELRRRWKILFPKPPDSLPKSDGNPRPLFERQAAPPPALPRMR